jgi:CBS domain-containing protein
VTTTAADIMTRDVITLTAGADLTLADDLMKLERIRHLPVVDGGKLVGLVSHRDIIKAHARLLAKATAVSATPGKHVVFVGVNEMMQRDVKTIAPTMPAKDAAGLILENRLGCLPVVDGDALVGIVTEVDCLRWALGQLPSGA